MKFDLHLHTTRHSRDSVMDPVAMVCRALELGLDGVVITEHDCLWTEAELVELRQAAPGLVVLAGVEVSAREGHFLAYGVEDPQAVPPGIEVAALCREVHRQGGAVVAAHPFRWGQPFREILEEHQPELDGLELMTSNMDAGCRRLAAEVFRERPFAGLGSSDAHDVGTLGFCYTEFNSPIWAARDLVLALRERRAIAHERVRLPG